MDIEAEFRFPGDDETTLVSRAAWRQSRETSGENNCRATAVMCQYLEGN